MALNTGYFYGRIVEQPKFYVKDSIPRKCVLSVSTFARFRNSQKSDDVRYDVITVMTENPEMMEYVRGNLREGDMVHIKGMVCTADIRRKCVCGKCEQEFRDLGYTCYIHPIHICKGESGVSEERGKQLLAENKELSNEIYLDAHVCTNVTYSPEYKAASYKVAVKRPFYIQEDPVDKKVDYPAVNTYYEQAESDGKHLHPGSRMIVKGSIRVRSIEKNVACPFCGNTEPRKINILEVVASHIGYIGDWDKPEDFENQDAPSIQINTDIPMM